ncbi:NADPH-dependent glutamate synthase [Peptoniphilus sp. KCTC 25270]|uniref:NADPH-dependent glutamate synthase n=1 Tax=Peptoniphilus sp. KCTC 25270 TaxID=2897414 RepID=UPI001E363969|nr:NADPH-dependent glutamate synthase [Peptoniphilus sp. KCTC 25270]MCD1146838.1 NADPH-dependent glutamate synthase [Peptoniphilus sp. KCTC 25270]
MDRFTRVPVREQDPDVRNKNFEEVCYGYNEEEAKAEAARCLNCKKPQCRTGCPVNIDIPRFISHIADGDFEDAASALSEYTALPAVCGRVCPQESQCEKYCVLGNKGDSVSIGKLERFAADYARENNIKTLKAAPSNGRKVAVIGAGPAGITVAGEMAKLGYNVTVFESLQEAGGVLVYGIPEFRLPDAVVASEVANLKEIGVTFETNTIVGRTLTLEDIREEGFEAIFIGSGAGLPRFLGIPGENLNGVFSANEFLTRCNLMKAFNPDYDTPIIGGHKTAIIGGGNVAMDAARVAKRLGSDVTVVYRRTQEELPAREEEVHHAMEEGIKFHFLSNPVSIIGDEEGWVSGMVVRPMELGEPDESGRRRPIPIEGQDYNLEVDTVIMALGTNPNPLITSTNPDIETNKWLGIVINEDGQTSAEDVFAGGDAVTGAATVILAMGAGKAAAEGMHKYLQNK